ncbi:uncharacterized protein LOC106080486 [Stomoxys calcitrans]|uniref:uncharacterized protein LOC106080486 n=1 Tax=Stomoxys calcitrans TaxID=35570 RepID=UPI0027E38A3D|nr:uncharacterized protein LOC106080486 [Stomoxys calcitrans]
MKNSALIIVTLVLLNQLHTNKVRADPIDSAEHIDSRLQHLIKRFDIMAKRFKEDYLPELQNLKSTFEKALTKDSLKDKILLLETYSDKLNLKFANYFHDELDKQFFNEDMQLTRWYVQEILPDLKGKLANEAKQFLEKIQKAYTEEDLDRKVELYNQAADVTSDEFWDYLNDTPEPEPVLNVHLKFFQDCLNYLLKERLVEPFEEQIRNIYEQVQNAIINQDYKDKLRVVEIFDDVSTTLGKFLNEKVIEYEIHKFGE